jgi:hypothetical protein
MFPSDQKSNLAENQQKRPRVGKKASKLMKGPDNSLSQFDELPDASTFVSSTFDCVGAKDDGAAPCADDLALTFWMKQSSK